MKKGINKEKQFERRMIKVERVKERHTGTIDVKKI